ncbi:MAG: Bicyclomycin resistance protein [Candidatus Celerinatantimonas neptuna]|nr:MAG: Bicyclomycin resistance protein [Candidatus Celerinatantimonas neptuna]
MKQGNKINGYFIIFLVGFSGLISASDNWIASLLLPDISGSFSISIAKASIVLTAYLIPYGVMQPIYGFYSDTYGKKFILHILMFFLAISTLFCSLAQSILWLALFRFITGFFAAGIIAVSMGILGDFFQKEQLVKYVGIFFGIVFLGQGLSSGIGGWLIQLISWKDIFFIFSIMAFCSFILIFFMPKTSVQNNKDHFWISIIKLLKNPNLFMIYLLAFCNGFVVLGGYSFIGSYLTQSLSIDYRSVGCGLMLFGLACFICGLSNQSILKKTSATIVLSFGLFSSFFAFLLLSFQRVSAAYVAILLLGFGYVFVQSILASRALDLAPENKGLSSGLVGVGIFGGGGLGTWLGSAILKQSNYQDLFLIFALLVIIPLCICVSRRKVFIFS